MANTVSIKPLSGKYYGTKIACGNYTGSIKIWYMGNWEPSQRQLDEWGMTLGEATADLMTSDAHFESVQGYTVAKTICDALGGLDFLQEERDND